MVVPEWTFSVELPRQSWSRGQKGRFTLSQLVGVNQRDNEVPLAHLGVVTNSRRERRGASVRPWWSRRLRPALALLLVAIACGGGVEPDPPGTRRLLFLGNSLTYTNDLPAMVEALAAAAELPRLRTAAVTRPGANLQDLWELTDARAQVAKGGWDVVVMQQGPSSLPESRADLREWALRFAAPIHDAGARPALYMVWPDAAHAAAFDAVSTSYALAAADVDGMLFPVGEAWRAAWRRDARLALYSADDFHPSPAGTYLAALVIVSRLSGRPAAGLPARFRVGGSVLEVPAAQAALLQAAADEANERFGRP